MDDVIVWSANVNCSHVFHEKCMQNWIMKRFKPDCPMCRQPFVNMSMNKDTSSSAGETESSIVDLDEHDVVERGEECALTTKITKATQAKIRQERGLA